MNPCFQRTHMLIGQTALDTLSHSHITVFGLGGVGSAAVEGVVRAGIGSVTVIDHDHINVTNINRQLIAHTNTLNMLKTDAVSQRIRLIDPHINIIQHAEFCSQENVEHLIGNASFVIDAIDTVSSKLSIISYCKKAGIPFISCMGTGNRIDPSQLTVIELKKTAYCPLAKVMRRELKKRRLLDHTPVVFSNEKPMNPLYRCDDTKNTPGSTPFVPPAAGFLAASFAVRTLINV